jgi:hypothetical protein
MKTMDRPNSLRVPLRNSELVMAKTFLVFFLSMGCRLVQAGPNPLPSGAPPLTQPLPPAAAIGSIFDPATNPNLGITVLSGTVAVPVTTLWEVDLGRFGQGAWSAASTVIIQDSPFTDKLHFRIPLNFSASPITGAWDLWVVFGGSPWGANVAYELNNLNPFLTSLAVPEPFALASYSYELVLTDSSHTVVDVLDPTLITGSAADLAGIGLTPNGGFSVVPESGSLALAFGLTIAVFFGLAGRARTSATPTQLRRTTAPRLAA